MPERRGFTYENAAFSGVQAFRDIAAPSPGDDAASLRAAYLGVLKLVLCDLATTRPSMVFRDLEIIKSRELEDEELHVRALGLDWPLRGLTMAGLNRLDDLQACVEQVVADGVEGDLVEAGTWRGGSAMLMRATLDTLGAGDRAVVVADSFDGFPEPEEDDRVKNLAEIDFLAVPVDEVRRNFARFGLEDGVEFVRGFFADTLHTLRERRWAIVRLDGDTYSATRDALEELYPSLAVGGHLILDDYGAFAECKQAVDDFRNEHGIGEPLEQVDWTCARWQRTSDAPIERRPAPSGGPPPEPPARTRERRRIPTRDEAEAERIRALRDEELDQLRAHAGSLETEVAALRAAAAQQPAAAPARPSSLRGAKDWLKARR